MQDYTISIKYIILNTKALKIHHKALYFIRDTACVRIQIILQI